METSKNKGNGLRVMKNMIRMFATSLILATLFCNLAVAQSPQTSREWYSIESMGNRGIKIHFDFKEVEIKTGPQGQSLITVPGLSQNFIPGAPLLPVLSLPLTLPDGDIRSSISLEKVETYPGVFPTIFTEEVDWGSMGRVIEPYDNSPRKNNITPAPAYKDIFPQDIYKLQEVGLFRDYQLSNLSVNPVQVTPEGVKFYKKFTITILYSNLHPPAASISSGEAGILSKIVVNPDQLSLISPRDGGYQPSQEKRQVFGSDVDKRVRIYVDQRGIYQVTGNDLIEAGVDITTIDPLSFRLSNKGNLVAFYIVGEQDGQFDPDDYFEFWGEPNEKTLIDQFPDQYSDPFSDENVYWLEWGGTPGLRMVEENASIVTNRDGEYNPSFFYRTTIHVEKNNHFERLGRANEEELSYHRDLWFFDSGVKAVGKTQYPFELIYPAPNSFNNVDVTAMFSGKSFGAVFNDGDPTTDDRVPHEVMVWLNNSFVGSSRDDWFDQDTSRITNVGNSTISNSAIQHGVNLLEVQMPTLPDITIGEGGNQQVVKGTDIVLLNWFDVTYDRLYRAHNNEIVFTRPSFISFPNVNLFQFDIDNFTRPDIDLYKIGTSKLVNFNIRDEVIDGETFYRITFQDEILTDDVKYVAVTPDRKKKPVRIEMDEPFDPDNPQRTLRDPSNRAEYIIITHERFFDTARELLDFRRGQGLAAELITTQEIYDEFNYGIKSPLAIQSFLKYAFFNWQRNPRLKYVVFVGDANFDYKSKSPTSPDFVPTFFYQTQEFGAAASDFPYSLVSGEDLVPDLFVGRIPVNTNLELSNVIEKLITYEQNPPVGAWRNRALFISGNDEKTYELRHIFGNSKPAFRSQNTRVMETLIPPYISSIRLNTIKDPNLPIDPNFGTDTDLIDHWDDGLFLINFMGHGGGGIWADVRLMDIPDVDRLNNAGMYPFITSMTCFTGAFENPNNMGLAQKLLLSHQKGAVGVLASSGLGYLHNDYSMLWYVGQFLFDPSMTIGEIVTLGKILYWSNGWQYIVDGDIYFTQGFNGVRHEMIFQYNLIGDPYLRLQHASPTLTVNVDDPTPMRGDTIQVTLQSSFASADGYVELADEKLNIVDQIPLFGVNGSTTVTLQIPDDIPEGKGLIRAYLSDGNLDASGVAPIGINYSVLQSVDIVPEHPGVEDTVEVRIRASDTHGIRKVVVYNQSSSDSIEAHPVPSDTSLFIARLNPTNVLKTVYFTIFVENNQGFFSAFRNYSYVARDTRPDITFVPGALHFTGRKKARLKTSLQNNGGTGDDEEITVHVRFYNGMDNFQSGNYFSSSTIQMNAIDTASVEAAFPFPLQHQSYDIVVYAEIDSSEEVVDVEPSNNVITEHVVPDVFNLTPQTSIDSITIRSNIRISFPVGSVNDSTAVRVRLVTIEPPRDQKGISGVPLFSADTLHAVEIRLLNPAAQITSPFTMEVELNPAFIDTTRFSVSDIKLYNKLRSSHPWTFENSVVDNSTYRLYSQVNSDGLFATFITDDVNAPSVELTVDGRPVKTSGLVSNNPSLYVVIQDESGIDIQRDRIKLFLDNKPISEDKVLIPDSLQKNDVMGISIYPELLEGTHQLKVEARDVNGNFAEKTFDLVVAEGFDVHIYGNYPNPFKDKTIFSYFVQLNDDLDEFEIRIYTVSGRLIKVIDHDINNPIGAIDGGARRKGYNELIWDGTDEDGQEVANGVYFAVVRATYQDKTIEKTLKVAKLK
ncbi:MAG: hypothetical protein D6748_11765 [Calditrichaeota bacterium]|nr:MAG: hypothetical protein D6748_11765 [Calditrichota bacterium]